MKLWQFYRKRIKEVEYNKSITWSNLGYALRMVYYQLWETSYYAEQNKQHAERRKKFLNGGA